MIDYQYIKKVRDNIPAPSMLCETTLFYISHEIVLFNDA